MDAHGQDGLLARLRQDSLFHFSASEKSFVFPVVLARDSVGLFYFDRSSGERHVIYETGKLLLSPRLSPNGEKLLLVRSDARTDSRELLTCNTESWRCRVAVRTSGTIFSPVEINDDQFVYASSPAPTGDQARTRAYDHDFYLAKFDTPATKLTNFHFSQLESINVANSKILFTAHSPARNAGVIPKFEPLAAASSDIFELPINTPQIRIASPSEILKPLFLIGGYSTFPSMSADGKYVAFLNRRSTAGRVRFNLAIASREGELIRYANATGAAFSRSAFVGNRVFANELLDDGYQVKQFDLSNDNVDVVLELKSAVPELEKLKRITLHVDG